MGVVKLHRTDLRSRIKKVEAFLLHSPYIIMRLPLSLPSPRKSQIMPNDQVDILDSSEGFLP
jgi:hypothetical protein